MFSRMSLMLLAFIAAIALGVQRVEANAIFRFSLNFGANSVKSAETDDDDKVFKKTISFFNHHIIIKNNLDSNELIEHDLITERPNDTELPSITTTAVPLTTLRDFWIQQQNLHGSADLKLKEIFAAITNLQQEITNIERRSAFLELKLDAITWYRNFLAKSAAEEFKTQEPNSVDNLEHYLNYIMFVDRLLKPTFNDINMEHTMDYVLLKLALEKYEIIKLKADVDRHVIAVQEAWERYKQTEVVKVDV